MATTTTYYFHFLDNNIIGYYYTAPEISKLPGNEAIYPKTTNIDPNLYIGMELAEFEKETPTFPNAEPTDRNSLEYRRTALKRKYFEILFTTELGEDTTALQAEYDTLLAEYNNLKNP